MILEFFLEDNYKDYNKSPLHNGNNEKANCDIDELSKVRFQLSIYTMLSNGMNLVHPLNTSAHISKWFTFAGGEWFSLVMYK